MESIKPLNTFRCPDEWWSGYIERRSWRLNSSIAGYVSLISYDERKRMKKWRGGGERKKKKKAGVEKLPSKINEQTNKQTKNNKKTKEAENYWKRKVWKMKWNEWKIERKKCQEKKKEKEKKEKNWKKRNIRKSKRKKE